MSECIFVHFKLANENTTSTDVSEKVTNRRSYDVAEDRRTTALRPDEDGGFFLR